MQYRRLGRSELMVGEVGIGLRSLAAGDIDDAVAALQAAINAGVNLIEVDVRDPRQLEVARSGLAGLRPRCVLVGIGGDDEGVVRAALEALGIERFDCYLASGPEADLGAVQAFGLAGMARSVGVAVDDPRDALSAVLAGSVDVVQLPFHPLELAAPSGVDAVLNAAQAADVGVLACSSLAGGRLGVHGDAALRAALEFVTDGPPRSVAQAVLAWALSEFRLSAVVSGPATIAQALENAEASRVAPLPANTMERITMLLGEGWRAGVPDRGVD